MPKGGEILWAEDNLEDQYLIRSALEGTPAANTVQFANDGIFLLDALKASHPRLVVLDLKMPRLGGLETLRRIRSNPQQAKLRVLVFSAGNQPAEIDACLALGALNVVQKPVDYQDFTAAVRSIVKQAG